MAENKLLEMVKSSYYFTYLSKNSKAYKLITTGNCNEIELALCIKRCKIYNIDYKIKNEVDKILDKEVKKPVEKQTLGAYATTYKCNERFDN